MTQLKSKVELDDITAECARSFDFEFDGFSTFDVPKLEAPQDFQIGLIGGSSTGSVDFEDHIAGVELDHIFTLALCGQRPQAQAEALQLISRVVGRPI